MNRPAVLTSGRVSHGAWRSTLDAMKAMNLDHRYIVSGTHFSRDHGQTAKEVAQEGYLHSPLPHHFLSRKDFAFDMLALQELIIKEECDSILVQGDTLMTLAGALIGKMQGLPVFHTHGGEISDGLDQKTRTAVTAFADVHFPQSHKAALRLSKMGVDGKRLMALGDPALDYIVLKKYPPLEETLAKYSIGGEGYILVLQNPWRNEDFNYTVYAVNRVAKEYGFETLYIGPNSDPGWEHITTILMNLHHNKVYWNLPYGDFLSLMSGAFALVGNSSGAINEAPHIPCPVVDIGMRQDGRDKQPGTISCPCDIDAIEISLRKVLDEHTKYQLSKNLNWSDGHAGERIAKVVKEWTPWVA